MKIIEVIERCDELYPNNYTCEEKIKWCDELGEILKDEYAKSFINGVQESYLPILDITEDETVVPSPHDMMYVDFIMAKCCYYQRDYDAYSHHINAFNAKLSDFSNRFIEKNMPVRESENRVNNWW